MLGGHKLIVDLESGESQLYDLTADPGEQVDLSGEQPEQVAALRRLIEDWTRDGAPREKKHLELRDEERERLKALGYL